MKRRVSVLSTIAIAAACTLAITGGILRALYEVIHNRGAETYRNVYGIQIHWITVLTSLGAGAAALLVAVVARMLVIWRDTRDTNAVIRQVDARQRETPRKRIQ
jgi:hypothetical protein